MGGTVTSPPQRIAVVGGSGAGKTTLATRLAQLLDLPHIELDALHWDSAWTPVPTPEFQDRVELALSGDRWVVDGNYQSKLGTRVLELADTAVWLDPGRATIMWRVIARTFRRARCGEELWNGNRETWDGFKVWRGDEPIVWWAWTSSGTTRTKFLPLPQDPGLAHLRFHRLRTRRDVTRFLAEVGGTSPG